MTPFYNLSTPALLESLVEYYERYKKAAGQEWNEKEYFICNLAIKAIHDELGKRGISPKGKIDLEGPRYSAD